MRRAMIALVACAACDKVFGVGAQATPVDGPRVFRKAITVHYGGTTTLASFPISVALDGDAELRAHARVDGGDIAFDDGSSALDSEVVSYAAGSLEAWVRVPAIASGDTTFYVGYGGSPRSSDPAATWAADTFISAWHLAEPSGTAHDSARPANDLVVGVEGGTDPPSSPQGVVGAARAFDATTSQALCRTDINTTLEFGTSSFSYTTWLDVAAGLVDGVALHKGGGGMQDAGYDLEVSSDVAFAYLNDGTAFVPRAGVNASLAGAWHQVAVVVDRGATPQLRIYADGALGTGDLATFGSTDNPLEPFCLARHSGSSNYGGMIDEVRVYKQAIAADWLGLEYANLAQRPRTITIGPEEVVH
jgi:hypothetical protein